MNINTKLRYGLRTNIHLAQSKKYDGIYQKQIAESQDISYKYLDSIIPLLKANLLIRYVIGKRSVYILTRPTIEISVFDVYAAFEHKVCIIDCLYKSGICDREPICNARHFWNDLNSVIENKMKSTMISDLM